MSERVGVVTYHLKVDMSEESKMTMLYKIGEGVAQEEHYGIALARVVDLPAQVLEVAERVSKALDAQSAAKKQSSKAFALIRRRKLVSGLKEVLTQAASGTMQPKALLSWLIRLQSEFIERMDQIDNDVGSSEAEETVTNGNEEQGTSTDHDFSADKD